MDPLMDIINNSEEPDWLEKTTIGDLRLWQIIFLSVAAMTMFIVMVCCCFRFRIPRTKQQIEADYQRRKITSKFRHELETIQDSQMDDLSLKEAVELLHGKIKPQMETNKEGKEGSQPMCTSSQQNSSEPFHAAGGQKPAPQVSGLSFAKLATKVSNISKLAPKSPTSPPENKMNF